jgi:Transposase, Mutator family
MEAEVSELVGAARGERAPEERLTHRNGYRARSWATRAGELELAIPKLRRGSYFPSFLEPRQPMLAALLRPSFSAASGDAAANSPATRSSGCESRCRAWRRCSRAAATLTRE